MRLHWAIALWIGLIALAIVLILRRRWKPQRSGIRFSTVDRVQAQGVTWASGLRRFVPLLRWSAILVLLLAVARPQKGNEQEKVPAKGIAIQMVLDVSSSMRALDFQLNGRRVDRITAAKKVMDDFITGKGSLKGRPDDLIGLITFARYADSKVPLTLDHGNLLHVLGETEAIRMLLRRDERGRLTKTPETAREDGTAIGDALGVAVERLRRYAESRGQAGDKGEDTKAGSKIIILLTDGNQTVPESMDPVKAAEIAASFGYKIYVIGAGSRQTPFVPVDFPVEIEGEGTRYIPQKRLGILNEEPLQKVAQATGGQYFRAFDTNSLESIYAQIDQLEKVETIEHRYLEWTELATAPMAWTSAGLVPRVWWALVLLLIEVVLLSTRFRKIP